MPSLPATHPIIGTPNDDKITGTRHSDVISGGRGNDHLTGEVGNDEVWGGRGDDLLHGNSGNDILYGSGGPTIINTTLIPIDDDYPVRVIFEGETAGYRNSFGYYKIDAETKAIRDVEIIWENASLEGSGGNLIRGQSDAYLNVQAGDNIGFFIISNGYSHNNFDALEGGQYAFVDADGAQATLSSNNPKLVYIGEGGDQTEINYHRYHTAAYNDTLALNPDGILHTVGVLKTDAGTLTIGFEDLFGGGDRDFDDSVFTIDLGPTNAVVLNAHYRSEHGLPDRNDIDGQTPPVVDVSDNDTLWGGTGGDELWGRKGDDLLYGENGEDELHGGSGNDMLHGGSGQDTLYGNSGDDMLLGSNGHDRLYGNSGADVLYGGGQNDTLEGGSGDDQLFGGHNNDQLNGGSGDDQLSGENGNDVLQAGSGNDMLDGGSGNDVLKASSGDDVLDGGSGNDRLEAGSGNDILTGGSGNDTLYGHSGDDHFDGGSGSDIINGGSGNDTIDYSSWASAIRANLADGTVVGNGTDTVTNVENILGTDYADKIVGNNKANEIVGGAGNDTIAGHAGDDDLFGGVGQDYLNGASGDDALFGETGDDILRGGKGSDNLTGGTGADTLWGGQNGINDLTSDTFYFDFGCDSDTIGDFELGVDRFALSTTVCDADADIMAAFSDTAEGALLSLGSLNGAATDEVLFAGLTVNDFQSVSSEEDTVNDWIFFM